MMNDFAYIDFSAAHPVFGVGVDMTDLNRFLRLAANIRERMAQRVLSAPELAEYESLSERAQVKYLARAFCVKEAVAKALGCGIFARDIRALCLCHTKEGRPYIALNGEMRRFCRELGIGGISLSVTHEGSSIIALAVAVRGEHHEEA